MINHQGKCLGQYVFDPEHNCYKQLSLYLPKYLYQHQESGEWYVGPEPGDNAGWMRNKRISDREPGSGWLYAAGEWLSDPSITIRAGELRSVCHTVRLTGHGTVTRARPDSLGTFSRTDQWVNGKPVWVNIHGEYLHSGNDSNWDVSNEIGFYGLRSASAPMSPADLGTDWVYVSRGKTYPANVSVSCTYK